MHAGCPSRKPVHEATACAVVTRIAEMGDIMARLAISRRSAGRMFLATNSPSSGRYRSIETLSAICRFLCHADNVGRERIPLLYAQVYPRLPVPQRRERHKPGLEAGRFPIVLEIARKVFRHVLEVKAEG